MFSIQMVNCVTAARGVKGENEVDLEGVKHALVDLRQGWGQKNAHQDIFKCPLNFIENFNCYQY